VALPAGRRFSTPTKPMQESSARIAGGVLSSAVDFSCLQRRCFPDAFYWILAGSWIQGSGSQGIMGGPKILFCIVLVRWMVGLEYFYVGHRHGVWRGSRISQNSSK